MEEVKRILVVSRMTRYCRKAVHYGVSLAQKYGAELIVIHVVQDPFGLEGWNLSIPSLVKEYNQDLEKAKKEIGEIIREEMKKGVSIKEVVKQGKPTEEVLKAVGEEKIDLLIMLAHEEGRLEHFLFGRSNEAIVRKVPCSMLLVKREPEPVKF